MLIEEYYTPYIHTVVYIFYIYTERVFLQGDIQLVTNSNFIIHSATSAGSVYLGAQSLLLEYS